ncbi:hypothetical protein QBC35DRAFT_196804 [Podospora australis]|uniref:Uncharacterized protein n=1 Tax=Podospora australis TaxID=1536484 RepID=A0AAN6X5R4_9PEZI|nr:hypothetical protein QBC35DRAFT_196804 [Podospora australis]
MEKDHSAKREGKGKGKAEDAGRGVDSIATESTKNQTTDSPLARIAQSATALPSFLMPGPASALSAGGEKGEASRVGQVLARAGESSVQVRSNIPSGGGVMRTGQTQAHIAQQDAAFAAFMQSDEVPMLSEPGEPVGAGELARSSRSASPSVPAIEQPSQSVIQQMARDGADVVALLSCDEDLEPVFELPPAQPVSEVELAGLRRALFGEGPENNTTSMAWDGVLNFIPEYLQAQGTVGTQQDDVLLSTHFGRTDGHEAWQSWIDQWSRVLTDYQDEVWGDLGALVDGARAEIKQLEEAKPGEKPEFRALLRLRSLLGHLRGT